MEQKAFTVVLKFVLVVSLLNGVGCSKDSKKAGSPDHNVEILKEVPPWVRPVDCRANIKTAICLVDPPRKGEQSKSLSRVCLPGSQAYVAVFEQLYDSYPPEFQKMFCSLRRIFVEREFYATAYATSYTNADGTQIEGAAMGVRQSLIDTPFSISHWSTWKEQLNFGGDPKSYELKHPYPQMTLSNESDLDFMAFVFAHEFGHLFDFANNVNQFDWNEECSEKENCVSRAGTWSSMSWSTLTRHRPEATYVLSDRLCFYGCDNRRTLTQSESFTLYNGLRKSPFISNYAATNAWDDFAETLAYWVLNKRMNKRLTIDYAAGMSFDGTARVDDSVMSPKVRYVEGFLRSSPRYP